MFTGVIAQTAVDGIDGQTEYNYDMALLTQQNKNM